MEQHSRLNLPSSLHVTILRKAFTHAYTYQGDVSTTMFGGVHGGGTRGGTYTTYGYSVHVRNNESEPRGYYFKMALFSDVPNKVVQREITKEIPSVKPGYTATFDVELFDKENTHILWLEDIFVKDANNAQLAHYEPHVQMSVEAFKNLPRSGKFLSKLFAAGIKWLGWAVIVLVGLAAVGFVAGQVFK